eukprot:TRINITY_DN14647_c0_g1_i1.p1 TRINITY_DN14647_c0_g1~~TRINITY_DN14647_c0_g1_i1.p1  ORF type:complete len:135 (-),score=35.81 TRINITY_DN14647_c0_g1_i1:106-510(-)
MLDVWESRNVFKKELIAQLKPNLPKELIQDTIPEGLPQIPMIIKQFAAAKKDMEKWKGKSAEFKDKFEDYGEKNVKAELKQSIELEQKYRMDSLQNGLELLKGIDAKHLKYIMELKKLCQTEKIIEQLLSLIHI